MEKVQETDSGRKAQMVPKKWIPSLQAMEHDRRTVCLRLLKTKRFKSLWRAAMREQLYRWLEGLPGSSAEPFTSTEWAKLLRRRYQ